MKTTRPTFSNRGQALVEACMSAACLLFFMKIFLIALYSGFATLWLDHQVNELALCESQYGVTSGECERQFRSRIGRLLKFGEIKKVELRKKSQQIKAQAEFKVVNQLVLKRSVTLLLPLKE